MFLQIKLSKCCHVYHQLFKSKSRTARVERRLLLVSIKIFPSLDPKADNKVVQLDLLWVVASLLIFYCQSVSTSISVDHKANMLTGFLKPGLNILFGSHPIRTQMCLPMEQMFKQNVTLFIRTYCWKSDFFIDKTCIYFKDVKHYIFAGTYSRKYNFIINK